MKAFYMDDLRKIIFQLDKEEITMSKALEIMNEKAVHLAKKSFEVAWSRRMNCKGHELEDEFSKFKNAVPQPK